MTRVLGRSSEPQPPVLWARPATWVPSKRALGRRNSSGPQLRRLLSTAVALDAAEGDSAKDKARVVLTVAVLAIVLTAPLGAVLIAAMGPRLLDLDDAPAPKKAELVDPGAVELGAPS